MLLQNKNALITGANRGIGKATVQVFAQQGANVWAMARTKTEEFEAELEKIALENGVWIKPVYADITDYAACKEIVMAIMKEKVPIDILVNNAGAVGANRAFQMTNMDEMRQIFEVNFFGSMAITQLVSRFMARYKSGSIVNIASVAGLDGDPAQLEYSASKAAIICATKKLAKELAVQGIRVNAVAPGLTDTEMLSEMATQVENLELQNTIMKRKANPKEIANAIAFMASDMASYITGQTLRVDGGR